MWVALNLEPFRSRLLSSALPRRRSIFAASWSGRIQKAEVVEKPTTRPELKVPHWQKPAML